MNQTLQKPTRDYTKRDNPNWDSNPNPYFKPSSPNRPKPIYKRKEELNKYAEKWETLPQAYEFVIANQDLLMNLAPEEAVDLYSRIAFYSKETSGRNGISKKACEKLAKAITTQHPELSKNAKESQEKLDREADYVVPELFKKGDYHNANSRLGSRFKTSGLEDKTFPHRITPSKNRFHGYQKRADRLKGIEEIAQAWATQ